jgi:hypothetical protein
MLQFVPISPEAVTVWNIAIEAMEPSTMEEAEPPKRAKA